MRKLLAVWLVSLAFVVPFAGIGTASAAGLTVDSELDFDTYLFDTQINFVPAHCDFATRTIVGNRAIEAMSCDLGAGAALPNRIWVLNKDRACRNRSNPANTALQACARLAPENHLQLNYYSDYEYVASGGANCDVASNWVVTILPSGRFLLAAYYDTLTHTTC